MKIWVKAPQESRFDVQVNREDKIGQIKASIQRAKGFEVDSQKLVWRGRTLADDATVGALNLHENDHLILLVPLVKEEVLELPFETPFMNVSAPAQTTAPAPAPQPAPVPISAPAPAPVPVPTAAAPPPVAAPIPIPGGGQLDLQRMLMELASAFNTSTGGQTPPGAVPPILTMPAPLAGSPLAPATPPQPAAMSPAAPAPVAAPPPEPNLPEPKPEDMQMLTEMGFPAERAKKALWLHRMNLEAAMEWLLMHSEDADVDAPLSTDQKRQLVAVYGVAPVVDPRVHKAVTANVCTYAVTGPNYAPQTWYQCYTCNLSGNEGCCEVCARVCHKGHQLSRARTSSQFYCDCGAGVHSFKCRALRVPTVRKSSGGGDSSNASTSGGASPASS